MLRSGKYSAWFKTPIGEGAGTVHFASNGDLIGGDTTFSYVGSWEQVGERFKITAFAKRVEPGPPGVFGMDEIDIMLTGRSDDDTSCSCSCSGFAKQAPGLKLDVTLIRMSDN